MPIGIAVPVFTGAIIAQSHALPATSVDRVSPTHIAVTVPASPIAFRFLPAGTPLQLSIDRDLSPHDLRTGDHFTATLRDDVTSGTHIVIPKNTIVHGDVTFSGREGGHGRAAIIAIALRYMVVGNRRIAVEGHYRETGVARDGSLAVVGIVFGALATRSIRGGSAYIPQGRVLRARLREDATMIASPPPITVTITPPTPARAVAHQRPSSSTTKGQE